MTHPLLNHAIEWVNRSDGSGFLSDHEYCSSRDIFQARLDKFRIQLEQKNFSDTSLLVAIAGEIGNNAFDHNLGKWRDIPGIYFDVDYKNIALIIADRGQGVRQTLSRVRPGISSGKNAIEVAFTEKISGRSPEQRGNGLKFVRQIVKVQYWKLMFFSDDGVAETNDSGSLEFTQSNNNILGCIAFINT